MIYPLIMLAALVLVLAAALILMARAILCPPRMTDGKAAYVLQRVTPADLGMQFQPVEFAVRDERTAQALRIAGWWIPHPAGGDKTVVLIHGYADAKVGSIAWAPTWRELGWHVLALDLRAHGDSDGRYTTAGFSERHDIDQVLNQFRASHPQQTRQVALFGASLGAAIALATADLRNDIVAVVVDCPFVHFRNAVGAHAKLLGLPLPSFLPWTVSIAEWMSGADFDQVQPVELLKRVKSPVMVIQSGDDPFVPSADASAIQNAMSSRPPASGPAEYWFLPDCSHLLAVAEDEKLYSQRIAAFLQTIDQNPVAGADIAVS